MLLKNNNNNNNNQTHAGWKARPWAETRNVEQGLKYEIERAASETGGRLILRRNLAQTCAKVKLKLSSVDGETEEED